ncbi:hypothetical protein [Streptomyces luteireticuli]|uniref:HNH endonuclease n=1 Tax=Streptomyces luteireticuli TaxID=173858 RepID=A0ABP3IN08_9ACTN
MAGFGFCLTCGRSGALEGHHVAGRGNHKDLVVDICKTCHHLYLSRWHRAGGVQLRHEAPRGEADARRAVVVGAFQVLALALWRMREASVSPEGAAGGAVLAGRALSRAMDAAESGVRVGRWSPDGRWPLSAPPVGADNPAAAADRAAGWARFALDVVEAMEADAGRAGAGLPPDGLKSLVDVLRSVAAAPGAFVSSWSVAMADADSARRAAAAVLAVHEAVVGVVEAMLSAAPGSVEASYAAFEAVQAAERDVFALLTEHAPAPRQDRAGGRAAAA